MAHKTGKLILLSLISSALICTSAASFADVRVYFSSGGYYPSYYGKYSYYGRMNYEKCRIVRGHWEYNRGYRFWVPTQRVCYTYSDRRCTWSYGRRICW